MFRSLFSRSRTVRVPIEHASSGVQVQKVRLYQPPVRPSLLLSTFFFAYAVFRLLEHAQEPSESDKGKRKWEDWKKRQDFGSDPSSHSHGQQQTQDGGLSSDVVATRVPIWFREKRNRQFHASDPEVQEFVRFQSDQKRIASAVDHITTAAYKSVKQRFVHFHRNHMIYIGYQGPLLPPLTDVAIVPQLIPPPSYEVPTVFIFKDGLSLGWSTLPPDMGRKWNVIFQPLATLAAVRAANHVFWHVSYRIIHAKITGEHLHLPPLPGSKKSLPDEKEKPGASSVGTSDGKTSSPSAISAATIQDLVKAMHDGQSNAKRHSEMLGNVPLSYPIKAAALAFRRKQMQGLVHSQVEQTRGSIKITGKLIYEGRFGKYILHIAGIYLPAEDRFLSVIDCKPELIVDFAARQKMLDWQKKNLAENGGHHRCPPDGNCPVHGKVVHGPDCPHRKKEPEEPKEANDGESAIEKPTASDSKNPGDEPAPDREK